MRKIDRLGWADSIAFTSFGVRIGIRTTRPDFARSLESLFPPGHRPTASRTVDRLYSLVVGGAGPRPNVHLLNVLYDGAQRVARDRSLEPVIQFLQTEIRRSVSESAPRRVFIHAGVVEWGGRAVVIPGRTMSGKSTLVAALVTRGATYYSDEYAVLDEKGLVHPFAKPLSIRQPGSFDAVDHSIGEFGGIAGVKGVPVGLVAVTRYAAGARWRPKKLSAGQGTLALLSHAIAARHRPSRVMSTAHRALSQASILKGVRGEAPAVAQQLLSFLDGTHESFAASRTSDRRDRKRLAHG